MSCAADLVWVSAGRVDQLGDDTAVHLDLAGYPVCLARSQGLVYALLDVCSHGQVALSDGDVEGGQVECWLHGSRFERATGVPTGAPPRAQSRSTRSESSAASSKWPCRQSQQGKPMPETTDRLRSIDLRASGLRPEPPTSTRVATVARVT